MQGSQIGVRSVGEKGTESARLSPSHCVLARGASRAVCVIESTNTNTLKHRNGWNSGNVSLAVACSVLGAQAHLAVRGNL